MATFYSDADLAGAGEFTDPELTLATEYTVPDGAVSWLRWRCPTLTPSVTPAFRIYDAGGSTVATVALDGAVTGNAWNVGTPASPIALAAGTYRASINTTEYLARANFFSGGPIVRGSITGVQGRFANGIAPPGGASNSAYFIDWNFAADGPAEGIAAVSLDLAAAGAGARASAAGAATVIDLALAGAGRRASAAAGSVNLALAVAAGGRRGSSGTGAAALGLAVAAAGGTGAGGAAALTLSLAVDARAGVAPPGGGGPRLVSVARAEYLVSSTRGVGG